MANVLRACTAEGAPSRSLPLVRAAPRDTSAARVPPPMRSRGRRTRLRSRSVGMVRLVHPLKVAPLGFPRSREILAAIRSREHPREPSVQAPPLHHLQPPA